MSATARQLEFAIDPAPRDGAEMLARLRALGLRSAERVRLTSNRTVMVSFRANELRIHRAYLDAPREVHEAIVRLVQSRPRTVRADARRIVLGYHVPVELSRSRVPRRAPPLADRDVRAIAKLQEHHAELNARHFAGALAAIEIRLSAQMRTRLGHYSPAQRADAPHIGISRRHLHRHGWKGALQTLLHEMVHQWQSETGQPLDHRAAFRAKARAVGLPAAIDGQWSMVDGPRLRHALQSLLGLR